MKITRKEIADLAKLNKDKGFGVTYTAKQLTDKGYKTEQDGTIWHSVVGKCLEQYYGTQFRRRAAKKSLPSKTVSIKIPNSPRNDKKLELYINMLKKGDVTANGFLTLINGAT